MREIWFKGKRKYSDKWVEGYYIMHSNSVVHPYSHTNGKHCIKTIPHGFEFEVDPETVCQYTEATAIGGKKIFEHDIVEEDGIIGVVKFGKYGNGFHLGFYIDWITCPHYRNELHFWEGKIKVIGNIFDNPELLEVEYEQ